MTFPISDSLRLWAHINDFFLIGGMVAFFLVLAALAVAGVAGDTGKSKGKGLVKFLDNGGGAFAFVVTLGIVVCGFFSGIIWSSAVGQEQRGQLVVQAEEVYGVVLSDEAALRLAEGASPIELRNGAEPGYVERFGTVEYTDDDGEAVAAQLTWFETEWVLTAIDSAVELDRVN